MASNVHSLPKTAEKIEADHKNQPVSKLIGELYRRMMRHSLVLLFTAGVVVLFIIENDLPLWLALLGFAVVVCSTLVYTGPPAAIDPRRWRAQRRYAMRHDAADLLPNPTLLLSIGGGTSGSRDGKILLANQAARDLFERDDLRRQPLSAIIRDPAVLNAVEHSKQDGKRLQVEWHLLTPVSRYFNVSIASALAPQRGMNPFLLISFEEQTEIRTAAKIRSDFIANASHELKTPIAVLTGCLETLKELKPEQQADARKFIGMMEEQSTRMAQLVEDLLSLSHIEQQEHKMPAQTINLVATIKKAIELNQTIAQRASMHIQCDSLPESILVHGDNKELLQVLNNLIHNGLTHGQTYGQNHDQIHGQTYGQNHDQNHGQNREKSEIRISVTQEQLEGQPAWAIHISDFGQGIADLHIPRLTERFYRINPEESRKLGGTGLGLAIVKHILARHRGELDIASQEGQGSTFTMLLPIAD